MTNMRYIGMKPLRPAAALAALFCATLSVSAQQSITERFSRFLTEPHGYVAYRTADPIRIDGVMDEPSWQHAPETELFMDISGEGFPTPKYATRAKMLWDDDYLYVSAVMEEPNVWANLSQRDTIIYGFTVQRHAQLDFLTEHTFTEDGMTIDRKLNVAMTRAREHLYLVGHAPLLAHIATFAALIDFCRARHAFCRVTPAGFAACR